MIRSLFVALLVAVAAVVTAPALAQSVAAQTNGPELFERGRCVVCHTGEADARAPHPDTFRERSPESVVFALTGGAMRYQGLLFSGEERRVLAEHLTGKSMSGSAVDNDAGRCTSTSPFRPGVDGPSWNGWSPSITNSRFQAAENAGLTAEQIPNLKLLWAFGFPDAAQGWSQPTVAGGRLYVGSQSGTVYSLSAKTGCIHWAYSGPAGVRSAPSIGPLTRDGRTISALYFADMRGDVYALEAATGELIWRRNVEDHPVLRMTGSPTLYDGRLYVPAASSEEGQGTDLLYPCCTFRGSMSALDANTGDILWKTYTIPDPPRPRGSNEAGTTLWGPSGVGIWQAPTPDPKRGLLYAGTGNTYSGDASPLSDAMLAFDMDSGEIRWSRQLTPNDVFLVGCGGASRTSNCPEELGPDLDFGASPVLVQLADGRDVIIAGQKSAVVYAMDPDNNGAILWRTRVGVGGGLGGIEWGIAVDSKNAYLPVADGAAPIPGGITAVELETGEPVWYAPPQPLLCAPGPGCSGAQSAAITVIPGAVFSGALDGGFRAFSTTDGALIWQFDTNREFATVNEVPAKGASINGPGPTVVDGMVYVNSGYGAVGGRPGNVLLAFGL
jgi:polyvinyl alcohol dehydrogenase (cytochrome)